MYRLVVLTKNYGLPAQRVEIEPSMVLHKHPQNQTPPSEADYIKRFTYLQVLESF